MKKYLLLICLIVTPVLAENAGELTVTGYPPPKTDYSSLASEGAYAASKAAAMSTGNLQATSFSNLAYVQMQAAQKAGKEAAKKGCFDDSSSELRLCEKGATNELNQRIDACGAISDIEAGIICSQDSYSHFKGRIQTCKESFIADNA